MREGERETGEEGAHEAAQVRDVGVRVKGGLQEALRLEPGRQPRAAAAGGERLRPGLRQRGSLLSTRGRSPWTGILEKGDPPQVGPRPMCVGEGRSARGC